MFRYAFCGQRDLPGVGLVWSVRFGWSHGAGSFFDFGRDRARAGRFARRWLTGGRVARPLG